MISTLVFAAIIALGACKEGESNFTITDEVTFDIEVKNYNGQGDDLNGQLVIGLFGLTVPVASLNFKILCEGFKRPNEAKLTYKNTFCHRMVKDMLVQCGDVFGMEGRGSASIYGEYFNDENFEISHSSGGIVGMANKGKDANGSQFFLLFGPARYFDKKHVAFGKVTKGFQYLAAINKMGSAPGTESPKRPVRITECVSSSVKHYSLSEKEMKTDDLEGIVSY